MNKKELLRLHRYSSWHRKLLEESRQAGCFYCQTVFQANEVKKWIDKGQTALCPHCEIDSVLPDAAVPDLCLDLLAEMHGRWFGEPD